MRFDAKLIKVTYLVDNENLITNYKLKQKDSLFSSNIKLLQLKKKNNENKS